MERYILRRSLKRFFFIMLLLGLHYSWLQVTKLYNSIYEDSLWMKIWRRETKTDSTIESITKGCVFVIKCGQRETVNHLPKII